jgi:hypothetical protein
VPRATVSKSAGKKFLADVPDDKRFWCADGQVLKNLSDLETSLKTMGQDIFSYHLNDNKNDFSNWVRDVIGDDKLAMDLQKSKTRAQAARYVSTRVSQLRGIAKAG